MNGLLGYVKGLKKMLGEESVKVFILGNSSADYDSIFGSLIYAFYMTMSLNVVHVPLIDCSKNDLKLRFEVMEIMDEVGISPHDLLYTEDVPQLFTSNFSFNLYDHNYRKELQEKGVNEIIDHHAFQPKDIYANYFIHTVASAHTLLYFCLNPNELKNFEDGVLLSKYIAFRGEKLERPLPEYDPLINQIIYNAILLDSFGFDASQKGRWNSYDTHVVEKIKSSQKVTHSYQQLEAMKNSIKRGLQLTLEQHLKKDFKSIRYGNILCDYAVILLPTDLFLQHYSSQLDEYFKQIALSNNQAYFLMFAYKKEGTQKFERQLMYRTGNEQFIQTINKVMGQMKCVQLEKHQQWEIWIDPSAILSRKLFDKQLKAILDAQG